MSLTSTTSAMYLFAPAFSTYDAPHTKSQILELLAHWAVEFPGEVPSLRADTELVELADGRVVNASNPEIVYATRIDA